MTEEEFIKHLEKSTAISTTVRKDLNTKLVMPEIEFPEVNYSDYVERKLYFTGILLNAPKIEASIIEV